jgi:hypothetical protein
MEMTEFEVVVEEEVPVLLRVCMECSQEQNVARFLVSYTSTFVQWSQKQHDPLK